ncbi:DMT family transporter [Kroppenstedtia eburnea]|uniref:Paired small multidrug resistance pump n=1 Tax=Kroppenstedtia eburnea TaxID=714067 RepID=A0A1N7LDX1_9BACL|nr:SMR family transporter [Kroppenstedtia eburnea]EGK07642.1 DMT superfamily drug/metabolite transporter [Desmospora sp. 8437]QKI81394.1 hypothetical protein GXN75_04930 [Kroppenstedtia eburnea]SIS71976.1 paired small multidrug resistance pump [Kroppenstedtia eburnea]
MGWLLIVLAAVLEIGWASGLKYAETPLEWIGVTLLIAGSFILLIRAYKYIPLAVAYSIFVGLGTIGTYLVGILLGDPYSNWQILSLLILMSGIIGMKITTPEGKE